MDEFLGFLGGAIMEAGIIGLIIFVLIILVLVAILCFHHSPVLALHTAAFAGIS